MKLLMKKNVAIMFGLISLLHLSCGSSVQNIPQPEDEMNLIIGSLIFDINGYEDNFLVIKDNIEVAIVGSYEQNGKLHNFGRWVTTGEEGYFCIANIPEGEYAIKGFRVNVMGLDELRVANELSDPQRNYFELNAHDMISLQGDLFDVKSNHRIVNFEHNIFTLHRNGIVDHSRHERLRNVKVSTGEIIERPTVPLYFLEILGESGWSYYLNLQLQ